MPQPTPTVWVTVLPESAGPYGLDPDTPRPVRLWTTDTDGAPCALVPDDTGRLILVDARNCVDVQYARALRRRRQRDSA